MTVIDTIAIIVAIVAMGLYLWKAKELKDLQKSYDSLDKKHGIEEYESLKLVSKVKMLEEQNLGLKEARDKEIDFWTKENKRIADDLENKENHIVKLEEEIANFQNVALTAFNESSPSESILNDHEFPFEFTGTVSCALINIPIQELIESDRLKEVFYSLVQAKLFPAKIKNQIDYLDETEEVLIYCNQFDEDGDYTSSLSWQSILSQILAKRSVLNEYLMGVIQESETAMVVSKVLTEKKKSGEGVKS